MMGKIKDVDSWHWTPSLSVGVRALDDDHKRLFQLLNEAHLTSESDDYDAPLLKGLAHELILYTQTHFRREEAVMAASAFPFCEEHLAEHCIFIEKAEELFDKAAKKECTIAEFIFLLKELLIAHIRGNDQLIGQYTDGFDMEIEEALKRAGPLSLPDKIRFYIVDDDCQQVDMMAEILDIAGFSVSGFTSSISFVKQPISNHDIILLDLNMPEMDGIEVMRTLYGKGCTPTYLLISGFDERVLHSAKQFAEAKNIDVTATYTKPINTQDFIAKITELHTRKELTFDKKFYKEKEKKLESEALSLDELKTALKEHQFVLFYQPQVEIKGGKLHGFEALVRLQHPSRGLIFPGQFIELAEKNGLISDLTDEVFRLVVKDYEAFQQRGFKQKISVNISAQDLLDLSLPDRLVSQLNASDISPESIMVELTESALMRSVSDSLDILNRLRMKGFALSIDDFGTGHSSLVQLYQAPFTELKIDLHFVTRMTKDSEARAIVKICILLAKELNLETVAEGVESVEILNALRELGCDAAQGYHISKPLPLVECCEWLETMNKEK